MQAYFAHFHPIFPIIHAASFHPSTRNSVLLLSICSIGSLFLGSPRAVAQGTSMFERLNKAILASVRVIILPAGLDFLLTNLVGPIRFEAGFVLHDSTAGIDYWSNIWLSYGG